MKKKFICAMLMGVMLVSGTVTVSAATETTKVESQAEEVKNVDYTITGIKLVDKNGTPISVNNIIVTVINKSVKDNYFHRVVNYKAPFTVTVKEGKSYSTRVDLDLRVPISFSTLSSDIKNGELSFTYDGDWKEFCTEYKLDPRTNRLFVEEGITSPEEQAKIIDNYVKGIVTPVPTDTPEPGNDKPTTPVPVTPEPGKDTPADSKDKDHNDTPATPEPVKDDKKVTDTEKSDDKKVADTKQSDDKKVAETKKSDDKKVAETKKSDDKKVAETKKDAVKNTVKTGDVASVGTLVVAMLGSAVAGLKAKKH